MSYINDALKKAQREKDNRYSRYAGVISGVTGPGNRRRRIWPVVTVLMMLMLVAFFVWMAATDRVQWSSADRRQAPEKAVIAAQTQVPRTMATGRETTTVSAVHTATVESAAPVKGTAQAESAPLEARAAGTKAATPVQSAAPKLFPDAGALYREALAAQRNKKTTVAEQLYRHILTLDAQHVEAMNNLGVLYMGQGRQEQAVMLFRKAIEVKKDYVDPHYNMACFYAQRNDAVKSIAYLKSAAAIDRAVIDWARTDMDMRNIRDLEAFKKLMEKEVK